MSDKEVIRTAVYDMQADYIPWGCDFGWEELTVYQVLHQVVEFQDVDKDLVEEVLDELSIDGDRIAKTLYFK